MSKKEIVVVFISSLILASAFFYKVFLGFIPIPADLLTGAYYPWLDYKWGYAVSVPVKNPALSDVISTAYPWKILVSSTWSQGIVPLWNPNVFSGSPLLANWQSGVFYPLNILMIGFGTKVGWALVTMAQPLLALFFMYLFLRVISFSKTASFFGGVIFAYAGYMMVFLEYNYLQAGIWIPLCLFLIEKFMSTLKVKWLLGIPILVFIIFSAGNFQITLFSIFIFASYFFYRLYIQGSQHKKPLKIIGAFAGFFILGFGMTAVQMFPTLELFQNSIRQFDSNIVQYNYGLLPLHSLITFIIPDFFGNPATGNFRGFIYHETMGYFGIAPLVLIVALVISKKRKIDIYALGLLILSLLLILDTFVGRFVYQAKIPLISTSYASRALFILTFAVAILAASAFDKIVKKEKVNFGRGILIVACSLVAILITVIWFNQLHLITSENARVSLRNSIFPVLIVTAISLFYIIGKKYKGLLLPGLILITVIDLFRFGFKYNPFTRQDLIFPQTSVLEYLEKNTGNFRVEREKTEVLPPNTWIPYGLMSPEGYDPLADLSYARFFNLYNGNSPKAGVSRYLELGNYNSPYLDLLGVKYLLMAKRQEDKITSFGQVKLATSSSRFRIVFEDRSTAVVENMTVMPRVNLFDNYRVESDELKALDDLYHGYDFRKGVIINGVPAGTKLGKNDLGDLAQITNYSPNQVNIEAVSSRGPKILVLTDAYYPGWEVWVNNRPQRIFIADGIFRAVVIPDGKSTIKFLFNPFSFRMGAFITAASLLIWSSLVMWIITRKDK